MPKIFNFSFLSKLTFLSTAALTTLLATSQTSQAFTFDKWNLHATTFYGTYSHNRGQGLTKFTNSFTSSKNAAYGFSLEFGRLYTFYNTPSLKDTAFRKFVVGAELSYAYLNSSDSQTVVNTETGTTYYKSQAHKNLINLGGFFRYYLWDTVYLKYSLGYNQTFGSESATMTNSEFASHFYKVKTNILTPYTSLGVGYDLDSFTAGLKGTYVFKHGDHAAYYLLTLHIGFNYSF
ncbi:hypothetical protein [Psittacicella hinzii]|uniref:Outer membrane protein beta-barrel domain-containing protein n=1 Tax=Psittacicella hinzii TaxID=2028575 RepID=A0A3A1YX70_9GAMM|nr:hypothetical protein [Psittacicella hinzii]RIY40647.1 hypothetical protein CKF58_00280 [Psittacicella hinzii]